MSELFIQQDRAFQAPQFMDGPPPAPEPPAGKEIKGRPVVQYEGEFDRNKARNLLRLREWDYEGYQKEEQDFSEFITLQLLTMLGERFNRGKSEFTYRPIDGKLVGEHSDEPLEDVYERGRAYREIHGNPQDRAREQAEVDGFRKIQSVMLDDETPVGAMMISISPPGGEGSTYKHNFFDLARKKDDGEVEMVRYSSALSVEETMERLFELSTEASFPIEFPEDWSDAGLLANPILLDTKLSMDQIYRKLHRDHDVMSDEEFDDVTRAVRSIITSYIACLIKEPENVYKHNVHLNAILNAADLARVRRKERETDKVYLYGDDDIEVLGRAPVRAVNAGCGYSGGFNVAAGESANGPYGVGAFASFGTEKKLNCICPFCKFRVNAIIKDGKITCPRGSCEKSAPYNC